MTSIRVKVNGRSVTRDAAPRTSLADFLREDLLLMGTHTGCEHGICGACTVVIDGEIARSCITLAVACDGAEVRTIEDFDDDPLMAKLRRAFSEEHALQCGYCTPGMLIAARDLVRRGEAEDEKAIRIGMSGNLCRCTGYVGIVEAVAKVARGRRGKGADSKGSGLLGPAPGPGAPEDSGTKPVRAERTQPTGETAMTSVASAPPVNAGARVQTGEITRDGAFTRLAQTITVHHPRDAVWRFMADVEKVAACMPGVALDGPPKGGHATGCMAVKLGPIGADLKGEADVTLIRDEWRGLIEGRGRDARSASLASGQVEYALTEAGGGDATRIDVSIAYSLAGPLAQFSRGALVRDLVSRLAAAFAQNLEARLSGREADAKPAALDAGSLVFSVLWTRIKAVFARLAGRRPG